MSDGGQASVTPTTLPPPSEPGRSRFGSAAIVIAILAVVVVFGVITGIAVLAIRGGEVIGIGTETPSPSATARSTGSIGPSPAPSGSGGPPITAVHLPTTGDLVWSGATWHAGQTTAAPRPDPVAPCQTWAADGEPTQTAIQGREFSLGTDEGRAFVYVISYPTEADAVAVVEALTADGLSCADRIAGTQGPRIDVSGPLGSGVVTDVTWTGPDGPRVGSWGVARSGGRVVWLWMEAGGEQPDWVGRADGHPMVASLNNALRRLRV